MGDVLKDAIFEQEETSAMFPFCHPDISEILAGPLRQDKQIDKLSDQGLGNLLQTAIGNFSVEENSKPSPTVQDLIQLAVVCDRMVFSEEAIHLQNANASDTTSSISKFLLSLVQEMKDSDQADAETYESIVTTATLLALNALESTIRQLTAPRQSSSTGAPLLKNMIAKLPSTSPPLAKICELLLLPHDGLNLRNLVWHGFVAPVPRPWLALVVVLTQELQKALPESTVNVIQETRLINLRDYPELNNLLDGCADIVNDEETGKRIVQWVNSTTASPGHAALCEMALKWIKEKQRPATFCAILSIVLEHCLRLMWCNANERPEDMVARPGAFYVTLDGHGQRHVHDLILHPFVLGTNGGPKFKNKLLWSDDNKEEASFTLSRSCVALLTDLYCSPLGPNIRASIAHGMWEDVLMSEWQQSTSTQSAPQIWDMVHAIFHAMDHLSQCGRIDGLKSNKPPLRHQPVFSYAQDTRRLIDRAHKARDRISSINETLDANIDIDTIPLQGEESILNTFGKHLGACEVMMSLCGGSGDTGMQSEFDLNRHLASCAASRGLLELVASAYESHVGRLEGAVLVLNNLTEGSSTSAKRKRKKAMRLFRASNVLLAFYNFAFWVAVQSLERRDESSTDAMPFEVVKRSTMVVSTVDTFVDSNLDRAIKAIVELTKSKALKQLVNDMQLKKMTTKIENERCDAKCRY